MANVELTEKEKQDLLDYLNEFSDNISQEDISVIEEKLDKKINRLLKNKKLPNYTNEMFKHIVQLAPLIHIEDIEEDMRKEIIAALHYFIRVEDKIPDYIPVVGYLDDAFIISTVYDRARKHIGKH